MLIANNVFEKFNAEFFKTIPWVPEHVGGLGLTKLRQHLQAEGRLNEARLILGFEVSFLPCGTVAKQDTFKSLLQACDESNVKEPIWFIEGKTRLDLAKLLRSAGQEEEARRELMLAAQSWQSAPVSHGLNNLEISMQFEQLASTEEPDSTICLHQWISFSENLRVQQDQQILSSSLQKAAEAALTIVESEPNDKNRTTFWLWQSQAMSKLEELGDIYTYHLASIANGQSVSLRFNDHANVLQWLDEFAIKYPDFNLYQPLMVGLRRKLHIYGLLKDEPNMFKTVNEIQEVTGRCAAISKEIDGYDNKSSEGQASDFVKSQSDAFLMTDVRNQWFSEWLSEAFLGELDGSRSDLSIRLGTNLVGKFDADLSTLLRWLQSASTQKELSDAELGNVIGIEDSGDHSDNRTVVQQLTTDTLALRMFGPDPAPKSSAQWQKTFLVLQDWLVQRATYDELKRHVLLAFMQMRMLSKMIKAAYTADCGVEAQRLLDLRFSLCSKAQEVLKTNSPRWRNIICGSKKTIYASQDPQSMFNEENDQFREIVSLYNISLNEFRDQGDFYGQATTSLFIAQHYFFPAQRLRPAAFEAYLQHLDQAERMFRRVRESWKILAGWSKVQKLLKAAEEQYRLQITPLAAQVLTELPDTFQMERDIGIWRAIQNGKSSGLGWLMQTTNSKSSEDSSKWAVQIPHEYEEVSDISQEDLDAIGEDSGCEVVFVDWFNGSMPFKEMSHPLIATMGAGAPPKVSKVAMTWSDIDTIVRKIMSCDEEDLMKEETKLLLHQLNPLVEPLAATSKPGQTLIFSLTGDLHRIPFHALQIDGEVLVRRNPIVYCSSMTVLSIAYKTRKRTEEARDLADVAFTPSLFCDPPSRVGTKAYKSLATSLSVDPYERDSFTSSNLVAAIKDPQLSLLHYHSHVTFKETDPLDHGLELDDRRFNLREVFDLAPVQASYHATLLGCGSGMSMTTLSNDVVGLVSAFLYAGASSTISTLWSFDDKDAAMYTTHFYKEIVELVKSGGGGMVDLAKANQRAMLAIMEKRPELYHWAPFIFNGYWVMKISPRKKDAT